MDRAIRPSSVLMPVAVTTASARPLEARHPKKAMFFLSPNGGGAAGAAAGVSACGALVTATDSPVRIASSTAKATVRRRRTSAGTFFLKGGGAGYAFVVCV